MAVGSTLKVAFFIDEWKPGSGTENQLKGLLDHLDPEQVDAKLFTLRRELPPEQIREFKFPVECLAVKSLASVNSAQKFIHLVRQLRRGCYHVAMVYFLDSNIFAVPACRLAGIKAIVVNRRDMGYWHAPGILRKVRFVNKWSDYCLVNSKAVMEQVAEHENFPRGRIHVLPNGLWDLWDGVASRANVSAFPFPAGARLVVVTANLRPVKRLDRFLAVAKIVAARVPSAHFAVAGQGELKDGLIAMARDLGLADKVTFLGHVSDVRSLLALAQVGVLTSESEGLSNSLLEYCMAGLPAVAFDTGGNAEAIRDGETGFLAAAGAVEQMADHVVRLLEDEDLRLQMGTAGRARCLETFGPEKILARFMVLIHGIAESPRRRFSGEHTH